MMATGSRSGSGGKVGEMIASTMGVIAACAVLIGTAVAMPRQPSPEPIALPFRFTTRQPIIDVRVNGGAAVPFVVDTGASIHLIDRDVAAKAAVSGGRAVPLAGGGSATVETRWVDGLTLAAGRLAWDGQRAALAPLGYPDRKHFAGLLGAPILMRYTVQFDFPARIVRLFDPTAYAPPLDAVSVPFELMEDLPVVHVAIDAGTGPIDARLMFDTGASAVIDLNRPFVERHKLVEAMPDAAATDRPAALGGTAPFLYGVGRSATLGGLTVEMPRLGLSRATSGSSSRSERDGIIGNGWLQAFVVTVDYRRKLLVLEQPAER
jgi:hypothetical protein